MSTELILTDARLLLRDRETSGTIVLRDGRIADIDEKPSRSPSAIRLEGSILAPGLVELHTDNLERYLRPRPGVAWPALPALMAHDAELVAAGITTVCDALVVGDGWEREHRRELLEPALSALKTARDAGMLRADHRLHLRCEVADENTFEVFRPLADESHIALVSLMDHTPGQRQFADVSRYRTYFGERYGMSEAEIDSLIERAREGHEQRAPACRRAIASACRERRIPLASHDDATEVHVEEAASLGLTISEFPTTEAAARAARAAGLRTVMGAPNLVRGRSHSGNISAACVARAGLLDALSSDYAPISLLHGAILLRRQLDLPLAQAFGRVTRDPAGMVGLDDRGEIACGKAADLVAFDLKQDVPVVRHVWRAGRRVH